MQEQIKVKILRKIYMHKILYLFGINCLFHSLKDQLGFLLSLMAFFVDDSLLFTTKSFFKAQDSNNYSQAVTKALPKI
jgi:hypothetical protein